MEEEEKNKGPGMDIARFINENGTGVTHFDSVSYNPTVCSQAPYREHVKQGSEFL